VPLVTWAGPVDINTADASTLAKELNGVGPARAQAIVAYRTQNGPFKSVDDLALVKNMPKKVIKSNRENIRIDSSPSAQAATKASPKEMLPVVDKPLIQYAVEEALAAGARRLVFITGSSKRAIEDHFDSDQELEHLLATQGKSDLLNSIRSVLPSYATCIYIRQPAPLGLGHAVLSAQPAVGAEPFFVHLADELMREEAACAYRVSGKRYDCGSKLGYMQATVEYALGRPERGRSFRR